MARGTGHEEEPGNVGFPDGQFNLQRRAILTVLADAQMGQVGMVGEQQRLYFSIITS